MADWTTNKDLIQKLYIAFYGRPADPGGLRYWAQQLPDNAKLTDASTKTLIDTFISSDEAKARIGNVGDSAMHDSIVDKIYTQAFHRDATAAEKAQFASTSISDVLVQVLSVSSGSDYAALNNKLDYANWFVETLDPNGDGLANDDSTGTKFMATFVGNTDASDIAAKMLLVDVDTYATETAVVEDVKAIAEPDDPISKGEGEATGETFTLTNSTDNITGTSGNDTFIGDNVSTSAGDTLNGAAGTDTLKLFGTATSPNYSGIENVYLNAPGGNFDVSGKADVKSIELDSETGSQTLTVTTGQTVKLSNETTAGQTTTIAGNTPTSLDVTVNAFGTAANQQTLALTGTGVTTLNLSSATAASNLSLTNAGGKLATVNVTGDQAVKIDTALATITTLNASAATGALNVNSIGASNLAFTGGSGNDKIVLAATLTAADTIKGGAGTDTLSISDADTMDSAAEVANVTEFEIFEAAAADGTTYDLSFLNAKNSLTGLVVSGAATVTVSNINADTTGNIKIIADTTTVLTAKDFVSGGTSDTATITLDDSAAKTGSGIDVANLTFANLDVLNLVSNSDGTPTKTVGGAEENSVTLTATDLEKIVVTGDEAVAIATVAGTLPTEIDASGMTGAAVSIDTDASAIVSLLVKGTAKNDSIDIDNAATLTSTLYLGGGSDTVVVIGGGTAAHALKFTAEALNAGDVKAGNVSTVTLTGVAAGDVVTLDFTSAFEGLLKSGGTVLSAATANVNIHGTALSSTTNIAASQAGGNMVVQIDLNGDGAYNAADDYQITLVGTGTDDTLVYKAATDVFTFTVA